MHFHSFPILTLLYNTCVDTSETTTIKLLFWFQGYFQRFQQGAHLFIKNFSSYFFGFFVLECSILS